MRKTRFLIGLFSFLAVMLLGVSSFVSAQSATQITFWHAMTGNNAKVVTQLVSEFNASHTDVQVTEQNKGSSYNDVLNTVIAAAGQGQGPNISQIFDLGTPIAIDSGFFTPIQKLLSADQLAHVQSDVMPSVLAYFTVNGTLWSLPWNNSTPLFYYNKDMFTAAGLDPNTPPATWQDLEADCAKIMAANAAPYCISAELYGWFYEQWMALQGQELANNGNGRAGRATETNITSDASKNIFTFWKDLNDKGYYTYTGKLEDGTGSGQIFTSKQAAMILDSTGSLAKYTTAAQAGGFQLGTGFFPTNGDVPRAGVIIGGASLWVSAANTDAQNQASIEFLTWLHEPQQMAEWHKGTGYMPITKSSQDLLTSQGYYTQNPNAKTAIDQLAAAKVTPATAGAVMGPFPQIRTMVDQALQTVLNGGDIDSTLSDLKTQADAALADYNSRLAATPEATAAS